MDNATSEQQHASKRPTWPIKTIKWLTIVALLLYSAILYVDSGRTMGPFTQLIVWFIGSWIGTACVLSYFAPTLVPDWMKASIFRGPWRIVTMVVVYFVAFQLVKVMYIYGKLAENNAYIRWGYYTGWGMGFVTVSLFLFSSVIAVFFLKGMSDPQSLGFKDRPRLLLGLALVWLHLFAMALVTILSVALIEDALKADYPG